MNLIAITVILFVLSVSVVLAQLPTGTILGHVKDASGAVVAGAKVTARNTDTSQTRIVATGQDGSYRLDPLPVGNYDIAAEKTGFKTEIQGGLTLIASICKAVANFTIQVGEIPTSSLGGLVEKQRIVERPLNGRNDNDLTLLRPGVTRHMDVINGLCTTPRTVTVGRCVA